MQSDEINISVVNVPVPTGDFKPKQFDLRREFHLIETQCKGNAKQGSYGEAGTLYNKELIHVQQVACDTAIAESGSSWLPFICKVGKKQCLVQSNEKTQAAMEKLMSTSYSALVFVWEGRSHPPEELDSHLEDVELKATKDVDGEDLDDILAHRKNPIIKWERFGHDTVKPHSSGLRFRWTKVELYPYTKAFDTHDHMQRLIDEVKRDDVTKVQLYHVKVSVEEKNKATLPQLILQVEDNTHMSQKDFTQHMVRTLLGKEYERKDVVLHTKKFYDMRDKSWNVKDVQLVRGTERRLTMNANQQVKLWEANCYKLFMYNGLASDLVFSYFGKPPRVYDYRYLEGITKALRGRFVEVIGSDERRPIFAISEADASRVRANKHRGWRDQELKHPKLLCLDLGSKGQPALIPPELCVIEPHQSFTGKETWSLRQEIVRLHEDLDLPSEEVYEDAYIGPSSLVQRDFKALDDDLFQAFPYGVKFLLVEAGVGKLSDDTCAALGRALKENGILKRRGISVAAVEHIFLQYQPGASADDLHAMKAAWKARLQRPVDNQSDGEQDNDKKPSSIVVALIQDDQHNRDIYHMLKYITECEVGVQSYSINVANVNRLAKESRHDGGRKVANEVVNRMCIRNPRPSPAIGGKKDVAVALHIERKLVDAPAMGVQGSYTQPRWVYLVALFSRDFESSSDYRTKVHKLMSESQMANYNPADHVLDFVKQMLPSNPGDYEHRVTVLRTGYMPAIKESTAGMPAGRKAEGHKHVDVESSRVRFEDGKEDPAPKLQGEQKDAAKQFEQDHKPKHQGPFSYFDHDSTDVVVDQASSDSIYGSRANVANNEMGHIYTKLIGDNCTKKVKFSYILLSEDTDFRLTQEAKEKIATRCHDSVPEQDDSKGRSKAKAVFFIADTRVMDHDYAVGVHRNQASGNATLVKAELLGEKLSDEKDGPKRPDRDEAGRWKYRYTSEQEKEDADDKHWRKMLDKHHRDTPGTPVKRKALEEHNKQHCLEGHLPPKLGQDPTRMYQGSTASLQSLGAAVCEPRSDSAYGSSPTKSLKSKSSRLPLAAETSEQPERSPTSDARTVERRTAVTNAELRRLAQLWKDDRMEMYSQKWPVPTHMALLAAKRAWMHLRKDKWDDQDEGGPAPLALREVREELEGSLYYL